MKKIGDNDRGIWRFFASLSGAGAAFLPIGACPACWPAYAGLLGSLGLGFLVDSMFQLPVMIALLALALFALGFRAKSRRGYGPLVLGIVSIGLIFVFKFVIAVDPLIYTGLGGLVIASLWNAWPIGKNKSGSCPKCVAQKPETRSGANFPERRYREDGYET